MNAIEPVAHPAAIQAAEAEGFKRVFEGMHAATRRDSVVASSRRQAHLAPAR